jgi:hypothetical protein
MAFARCMCGDIVSAPPFRFRPTGRSSARGRRSRSTEVTSPSIMSLSSLSSHEYHRTRRDQSLEVVKAYDWRAKCVSQRLRTRACILADDNSSLCCHACRIMLRPPESAFNRVCGYHDRILRAACAHRTLRLGRMIPCYRHEPSMTCTERELSLLK